ncbi:MAG: LysR family transcriptional regulator [Lawsonibacter sp.]|nr:LysR family transcriptional regulator [Lawsonibacter sp.]
MTPFQLKCFISVESHLSFTKAAEDCHVVQATISRQISMLEEEIGAKLFERDSHGVRTTPAGDMLAHYAPVFVEYQKTIFSRVRNASTSLGRTLRIAVGPYEVELLREPLRALHNAFPSTNVELTTYTYYVLMTRYRNKVLDMAFCNELCAAQMTDFRAIEVCRNNWLLTASKEHPIWNQDLSNPEAFSDHTIITLVNDQYDAVRRYCYDYLYSPRMIETNFLSTLLEQVKAGMGISILPAFVVQDLPAGIVAKDILPQPFVQPFFLMLAPDLSGPDLDLIINLFS